MAHLPDALDSLTPEGREVYARVAAKRGAVRGPFAPLMHHPQLAERVAALGEYLRFDATLPGDVRELAVLITARAAGQPFEWVMHAPVARKDGLPESVIEHVRARRDLAALPPRYVPAARVVQHVLAGESVPQALADEIKAAFGVSGLIELVILAGYYRLIAGVLFAFDVTIPAGERSPF